MTPQETRQLLAEIDTVDNRKLTPEVARLWHEMLHGFDYHQCCAAIRKIRLNQPDLWITPGHIAQIIRGELRDQGHNARPECEHGIPLGSACYDCTHPGQPGGPTPAQGTIQADETERIVAGGGGWRDLADPDETARLARATRAHGVVYPGETTCPWGHTIDHDIVTARRKAARLPTCQDCVA